MSLAGGTLIASLKREAEQCVSLELREDKSNLLVGYIEVTLVPTGARIQAWNADDSDVDGQLIVHAERPT